MHAIMNHAEYLHDPIGGHMINQQMPRLPDPMLSLNLSSRKHQLVGPQSGDLRNGPTAQEIGILANLIHRGEKQTVVAVGGIDAPPLGTLKQNIVDPLTGSTDEAVRNHLWAIQPQSLPQTRHGSYMVRFHILDRCERDIPTSRHIGHAGLGFHDNFILCVEVIREPRRGFEDERRLVGNPALGDPAANAQLYFVGQLDLNDAHVASPVREA